MKTSYTYKTVKPLRNAFWSELKETDAELAKEFRVRKKQNQYCTDICCMWCDFVNEMQKSGAISESLANRATL